MLAVRADTSLILFERALTAPLAFDDGVGGVSESSAPLNNIAESGGNEYVPLTPLTVGSHGPRYLGCVLLIALCWAVVEDFGPGASLAKDGTVHCNSSGRG
jgi:hypothetical protein